jgi:basic amino acid/polyamine antiporter, APA family
LSLPAALSTAPIALEKGHLVLTGAMMNLPAVAIVVLLTIILVIGIKESASFNNVMVFVKCGVLVVFVGYGCWFLFKHTDLLVKNWTPFIPENTGTFGEFGWSGIFKGAAVIFFAYIGFDGVSTAAQETRNPQRDLPRGLLYTLLVVALLFISVSLVLTGMLHYTELNVEAPVIFALQKAGAPPAFRYLVEAAALAGLTSVALVSFLGQPRIFFSMANDGLLPPAFAKVHPRFRTPYVTTILTGAIGAVVAGVFPLDLLGELISIGTLMAFALVCGGILVLRKISPDIPRPFRTPWVPLVPILGVLTCVVQMFALPPDTWLRLAIWMGLGFAVYFGYSRRHSKLAHRY